MEFENGSKAKINVFENLFDYSCFNGPIERSVRSNPDRGFEVRDFWRVRVGS